MRKPPLIAFLTEHLTAYRSKMYIPFVLPVFAPRQRERPRPDVEAFIARRSGGALPRSNASREALLDDRASLLALHVNRVY